MLNIKEQMRKTGIRHGTNFNLQQLGAMLNQTMSIRNQNQHIKHHSYSGVSGGINTSYMNFQQMMAAANNNPTPGGYQKFVDQTTGLDRGKSNITAEEIAALYSNVLAT